VRIPKCPSGGASSFNPSIKKKWKQIDTGALLNIKNGTFSILHASPELRRNPRIVSSVLEKNGNDLQFVDQIFRANVRCVLVAIGQNGSAFQYATKEVRQDKAVCKPAISKSERCCNDCCD
jgi:hypothetical protein